MKISDYMIVSADSEPNLQALVKENIKVCGWQPIGGVHAVFWVSEPDDVLLWNWTQAMVKYAEENK